MCRKAYVQVTAVFDTEGNITPEMILWEDGTVYQIDRITNVCKAASLKSGGAGIRYTCRIDGKLTHLFLEGDRWFVEAKC